MPLGPAAFPCFEFVYELGYGGKGGGRPGPPLRSLLLCRPLAFCCDVGLASVDREGASGCPVPAWYVLDETVACDNGRASFVVSACGCCASGKPFTPAAEGSQSALPSVILCW